MSEKIVKLMICDSCGGMIPCKYDVDKDIFINFMGVKAKNKESETILDFCCDCWKYFIRKSRGRTDVIILINNELGYDIVEYEYIGCDIGDII